MKILSPLVRTCVVLTAFAAAHGYALDPSRQYFQYQYVEAPTHAGLGHGVHAMVQDHEGFLWLATDRGLVRFDGFDADMFRAIDHAGLVSNRITDLWVTRAGDLLIASEQGMSRYADHTFESIVGGNKSSAHIRALTETDEGTIWLGSARGLFRWQDNAMTPAYAERIRDVSALYTQDRTLIVGGMGVVFTITGTAVEEIMLPDPMRAAAVTDLTRYKNQIWGITQAGMFKLQNGKAVRVMHPELDGVVAHSLLADRDNNLWFYGRESIGRFLPDGTLELPDTGIGEFGIGAEVSQMIEDRDGHLWMASPVWALSALMDAPLRRISYSEGLSSAIIHAVAADTDDHILLATGAGISRLNGHTPEVVIETDRFATRPARSMLRDSKARLWVGTTKGLVLHDLDRDELIGVENVDPVPVNALTEDPGNADTIWIGTDLGLQKWHNGAVSSLPAVSGVAVESLFFDRRGTLWIGTETGLLSMGEKTLTLHASEIPGSLDAVLDITQLRSGQILATTRNHGLIVSTADGWQHYTERHGLPKATIVDLELHNDNVWLISSSGLFRFDAEQIYAGAEHLDVRAIVSLEDYRARHVDLCCSGLNSFAASQKNGLLAITTRDGVITLDMTKPDGLPGDPAPYIKFITINEQPKRAYDNSIITVEGKDQRLRVDYSALSLNQDGRLEFRYRVQGQSGDWMYANAARTVHLTNLPPGEFAFELEASITPGRWIAAAAPLRIRRTPALTETLMFRAALWLLPVGAVFSLFWLRSAVARRQHRVLETRIRERTEALRDVNEQLESRNADLRRASETDALTGLLNRRYFDTRHSGEKLTASLNDHGVLIMVDIDHFKQVNDTWGHAAGDAVLRQFADVLRAATRESDVVARWGGEEFMLLCRCQTSHAPDLLERIVAAVRSHAFCLDNGDHINVHCSLGAVLYPLWPGRPMDDRLGVLLELADAALYRVKSCGRDGWALLDGAAPPQRNVLINQAGPHLSRFIDDGHLEWRASRATIVPDQALSATGTG